MVILTDECTGFISLKFHKWLETDRKMNILRGIPESREQTTDSEWYRMIQNKNFSSSLNQNFQVPPYAKERLSACSLFLSFEILGTYLVIQWLGLWASTAKCSCLIPGWRTKIPHAAWHHQKNKQTKNLCLLGSWSKYSPCIVWLVWTSVITFGTYPWM